MKIEQFVRASSNEQVYQLLKEHPANKIIAGGAWIKLMDPSIHTAIDLSQLDLDFIRKNEENLEIGAMTTLRSLEKSELVRSFANGILSQASKRVMGISIKNIATIGGSVMGKFGFSDLLTPLLVLNAKLFFHNQGIIELSDYLNQKTNSPDLLIKVILPLRKTAGFFKKVSRTALDFSVVNVAVSKHDNQFLIAIGARPGVAELAVKAGEYLSSLEKITEENIVTASLMAGKEVSFSTNQRASAEYRLHLSTVYVERGIKAVMMNER